MKKQGIVFHPKSPYHAVCADVMLINAPNVVGPHTHTITPNGNASDLKEISIGNNLNNYFFLIFKGGSPFFSRYLFVCISLLDNSR